MRRSVGVLAAAALVGVAPACSPGGDDPTLVGDVPPSTTTEVTTSTTIPPTTTTEAACELVFTTTDALGLTEDTGDVDGDGEDDLVQSFGPDEEGDEVTLLVELAAGGGARTTVAHDRGFPAALLGLAKVEELDDRELLWLRVGAGASATVLGLYWFDRCTLAPVALPNGDPFQVAVGGSVGSVAGAECGSRFDPQADLIVYEGRRLEDGQYEVTSTEHRYASGVLTTSPDIEPTVERTDDPSHASRFRCGEVEL